MKYPLIQNCIKFRIPAQSWLYLFPCALALSNKFHRWHFLISTFFTIHSVGGWMLFIQAEVICEWRIPVSLFDLASLAKALINSERRNAPNSKSSNKAALPHRWLRHCSSTTAVPMEAEPLLELDPSSKTTTMIFWQKERIHSLSKTWVLPPLWSLKTCASVSSA